MGKINSWSLVVGVPILILMSLKFTAADQTAEVISKAAPVAATTQPVKPKTPQCYGFFPGTPGWNDCFQKFMQDMALYQMQMHEYIKNKGQAEAGSQDNFFSESAYNSNSMSTANSFVGGYAIRAINMPISSSINNNVLKVTLFAGPIEKFESKVNDHEIQLNLMSKGQQKYVKIVVPKSVEMNNVKVDRTSDSIFLTGPVAPSTASGTSFQYSQSSHNGGSSASSSNFGNQNFGEPVPAMPPIPMPDFHNMFQNMFQNMFGNMFGARQQPARGGDGKDQLRSVDQYYTPALWFY